MVPHTFCNKLKQKSGRQLYFKLFVKQTQERKGLRYILREKKRPRCGYTDSTKMMFVEGKNMPLRPHPKYEPHQPTPSIPASNKQGLLSLNLALQN